MKNKCPTCNKNCEGTHCFAHKQKKTLKNSKLNSNIKNDIKNKNINKMRDFFLSIWNKKKHICENCQIDLGSEPLSYHFDHCLEKQYFSDLKYEEENIMLLCLECHDNKTRGFLSPIMKEKIIYLKTKYNIL